VGRSYNVNFDAGLEFKPQPNEQRTGYNNFPVLYGSAEAFSDTSRFDRITLTMKLQDPLTGAVTTKGRFGVIHRSKAVQNSVIPILNSQWVPNIILAVESDYNQYQALANQTTEYERNREALGIEKAGEYVSVASERTLNRLIFNGLERRVARSLGLDVVNIETSIASQYYQRARADDAFFTNLTGLDLLSFANVGITFGRFVLDDFVFLKARGELVSEQDRLIPEYSMGVELQPFRYLLMDLNYGLVQNELQLQHNPEFNVQLRLPIAPLRTMLHF